MALHPTHIKIIAKRTLDKRNNERNESYKNKKDYYRDNPLDYFHDRLGVPKETIDWDLIPAYKKHVYDGTPNPLMAIVNSVLQSKHVGVEAGTGLSKTYLAACIALWFLEMFEGSKVITFAPKEKQLKDNIWTELDKLHKKFGIGKKDALHIAMDPKRKDWFITGFAAGVGAAETSATRAQGYHAAHMLIILEEMPGIKQEVVTAFQNTCISPHNIIMALGNPDHQKDTLHNFCTLKNVTHVRMSGLDFPNVVLKDPYFIPGAQTEHGLADMKIRYRDINNPLYQSRALGISPAQSIDSLIKLEWLIPLVCESDKIKSRLEELGIPPALGVDVANSVDGDEAAICDGSKVDSFPCDNSNKLGHMVYRIAKDNNIAKENIGVDGIGVGAGTVNAMKEYSEDYECVNIQSSAKPVSDLTFSVKKTRKDEEGKVIEYIEEIELEEEFLNLRSQMWWIAREDIRAGVVPIPDDDELHSDLLTPKYSTHNGKIVVESKKDIKKRLGRSPNKGDAWVYWNWKRRERDVSAVGIHIF